MEALTNEVVHTPPCIPVHAGNTAPARQDIEHQLRCRHFVRAGGQFYPHPEAGLPLKRLR